MRVQYARVCEGGFARPRDKDKPLVVDAAETAPASWRKRMPPCGVCGTSGADRVGQNVWGRPRDMPLVMEAGERKVGSMCGMGRGMPLVVDVVGRRLGCASGTDRHMPLVMEVVDGVTGQVWGRQLAMEAGEMLLGGVSGTTCRMPTPALRMHASTICHVPAPSRTQPDAHTVNFNAFQHV